MIRASSGRLIRYVRVSTGEQATEARRPNCVHRLQRNRSVACLWRYASVVRYDRLARSVSHLLAVIDDLAERKRALIDRFCQCIG
jgi:DNA invertase Pin-like site-specific DNA recombinase